MNRSSRVDRPSAITSNPVAIGSRVPAWPARRRAKIRRQRATTSCEVQPAGLSTRTNPSATETDPNGLDGLLAGAVKGETGRVVVATTTMGFGDGADVDCTPGAETDLPPRVALLE